MSTGNSNLLPAWVLSPKEEKQVYANWRSSAYAHCDDFVKRFSECAKNAGVKVTLRCSDLHQDMYNCLQAYQTNENLDKEYDKLISEKQKKFSEHK